LNIIKIKDALTGEDLEISYDLAIDKMVINGVEVVRKKALESNPEEFVFGMSTPGTSKLFHLSKEQIEQMKQLSKQDN